MASASAAAEESRRRHEIQIEQARRDFEAGQADRSCGLLESLQAYGEERESALALLDRLDGREGRVGRPPDTPSELGAVPPADPKPRPARLRSVLLACWAVAIGWLGSGLTGRWDSIVDSLLAAPAPASRDAPITTELPAPRPGERALEQASRLLAQGDAAGAVAVLNGVSPDDPAYPFSRRLRLDAQAALASPRPQR